jgi:hypothetical protein
VALERDATSGIIEVYGAIAQDPDPHIGGRRRVRMAFDGELGRSLTADPVPTNRLWTDGLLASVRHRSHYDDLIGVTLRWVSALDDCVIHATNAVETRELPVEYALRDFLRTEADDDDQLCTFMRRWGPLDYPDADYTNLSVTPGKEVSFEQVAERRPPLLADLIDPTSREPWWHDCLARVRSLVDNVDGDDWEPAFVPFKTSECGDFGAQLAASPLRLQRALMHLYQSLFESWIVTLGSDNSPRVDVHPTSGLNPDLVEIWRHHHLEAPWSDETLMEAITALLNAGVQPFGPHVAVDLAQVAGIRSWVGKAYPRITSALCMQVLAFIGEGLPAKVCQNESCQKYFVRQQGRASHAEFRTTGVQYCSSRCARIVAQRSYRRRKAMMRTHPGV